LGTHSWQCLLLLTTTTPTLLPVCHAAASLEPAAAPTPNHLSGLRLRQYDEALIADPEDSPALFPFLLAVLDPDLCPALERLQFIQLPKLSERATSVKIYICNFKYNSVPHKRLERLCCCTLPHIFRTIIAHGPIADPLYACLLSRYYTLNLQTVQCFSDIGMSSTGTMSVARSSSSPMAMEEEEQPRKKGGSRNKAFISASRA
jgi:hypothetical protein